MCRVFQKHSKDIYANRVIKTTFLAVRALHWLLYLPAADGNIKALARRTNFFSSKKRISSALRRLFASLFSFEREFAAVLGASPSADHGRHEEGTIRGKRGSLSLPDTGPCLASPLPLQRPWWPRGARCAQAAATAPCVRLSRSAFR